MHKSSPQLTLGLQLKDEATFDNFYSGKNSEMIATLKKTASGQGEKTIYLCGARGQGLSHLLNACCHEADRNGLVSVYLPLQKLLSSQNQKKITSDILNGLESLDLICIDDLHAVANLPEWEEAIFHLYNKINDKGGRMIIAANDLPKAIQLKLPDLVSRLSWGVVYQLHPLSDNEKLSVLAMRAERRGINLSEEVGRYILTHSPRHMGTLLAALDVLDKASLAAQRRLTIPFVKEVLEI